MKRKVALITGITGQDGSYLAELLLKKKYTVHGIIRRSSSFNTGRIDNIYQSPYSTKKNFILHYGDLTDSLSLQYLINKILPDEIYNLAAQSHVRVSFDIPEYTSNVDALGTLRILETIRSIKTKKIKLYQASTSELFGNSKPPQNENTLLTPQSPYGVAKLYSYWMIKTYRNAYGIFASNGILFNHESERRGGTFITKKIVDGAIRIKFKKQQKLYLGNLEARRDWGYAVDYVEGMYKILQYKKPDDFVLATGKSFTVRKLVEIVFKFLDMPIKWKGRGLNEKGIDKNTNKILIEIKSEYFRPLEVNHLKGDFAKARKLLNWSPSHRFEDFIHIMIKKELDNFKSE